MAIALFLSSTILDSSFIIPISINRFTSLAGRRSLQRAILQKSQSDCIILNGAQITEFDFEDEDDSDPNDTRTDEEKGLSHGYEGDFKIGDVVKVRCMANAGPH